MNRENLLNIENLHVEYSVNNSILGKKQIIYAVNGVSLNIKKGEIMAIAGESGCGKSSLAKAILKLEPIKDGCIIFNSCKANNKKTFRQFAQIVFQNPYASLNPKMKIIDILSEPLEINADYKKEKIHEIVREKIKLVGLDDNSLDKYPHEFSGGQRQRIAIARALMLNPEFIVADEPVSALDVSIQAQIINLIKELKETQNITFLLITHDMRVIEYLADRTAIMYLGEIVEQGNTKDIFANPMHPYTKALINSVPSFEKINKKSQLLKGDLPSPADLPDGCKFHTRCPRIMDKCKNCIPENYGIKHTVKCFLYE